jgi:hypothetical protein
MLGMAAAAAADGAHMWPHAAAACVCESKVLATPGWGGICPHVPKLCTWTQLSFHYQNSVDVGLARVSHHDSVTRAPSSK